MVPVNIQESEIEIVTSYKYLGVYLNKLDWSVNTVQVYKKGQIRIHLNKGAAWNNILCSNFFFPYFSAFLYLLCGELAVT